MQICPKKSEAFSHQENDHKVSIYRSRLSDWAIFNNLKLATS